MFVTARGSLLLPSWRWELPRHARNAKESEQVLFKPFARRDWNWLGSYCMCLGQSLSIVSQTWLLSFPFLTWNPQDVPGSSLFRVIPKDWSPQTKIRWPMCTTSDPGSTYYPLIKPLTPPLTHHVGDSIWTWRESWQSLDNRWITIYVMIYIYICVYWSSFADLGSNAASGISDDKKWWCSIVLG